MHVSDRWCQTLKNCRWSMGVTAQCSGVGGHYASLTRRMSSRKRSPSPQVSVGKRAKNALETVRPRGRPGKGYNRHGFLKGTAGDTLTRTHYAGLLQCILSDFPVEGREAAVTAARQHPMMRSLRVPGSARACDISLRSVLQRRRAGSTT